MSNTLDLAPHIERIQAIVFSNGQRVKATTAHGELLDFLKNIAITADDACMNAESLFQSKTVPTQHLHLWFQVTRAVGATRVGSCIDGVADALLLLPHMDSSNPDLLNFVQLAIASSEAPRASTETAPKNQSSRKQGIRQVRAWKHEQLRIQREADQERERLKRNAQLTSRLEKAVADVLALGDAAFTLVNHFASIASALDSLEEPSSWKAAAQRFGFSRDHQSRHEVALLEEAKAVELARVARKKQDAYERTWLHRTTLETLLKINKIELDRWCDEGRIPIAGYKSFKKWGATLRTKMFDPEQTSLITQETIAEWRDMDAKDKTAKRSAAAKEAAVKTAQTRRIKKELALHDYASAFSLARSMTRQFELCLGPTNSGKTHQAMLALQSAATGVYLSPLRLLALENYERLRDAGVAVSLLTGEERIVHPEQTHVCATVEMCDFDWKVDVSVVDEIQMISDDSRGWAWTSAILGCPAEKVFVCGSKSAKTAVLALLEQTKDTYIEHAFERKTPLIVANKSISLGHILPGDAVIAFSRKQVLEIARDLRTLGRGVSVIYGALSPEVRRKQSADFSSGRSEVLVATDAIGMGLNLPIKRIVFSATKKFDGAEFRWLEPTEVQQIAGRAGRFGLHEEGMVTALDRESLSHVQQSMRQNLGSIDSNFFIMPTYAHVKKVIELGDVGGVYGALEFFNRITFGGIYCKPDLRQHMHKALLAEEMGYINERDIFSLACSPVDIEKPIDMTVFMTGLDALNSRKTIFIPDFHLRPIKKHMSRANLQEAEIFSRQLALLAWFGCKFEGIVDLDEIARIRTDVSSFINEALLSV